MIEEKVDMMDVLRCMQFLHLRVWIAELGHPP